MPATADRKHSSRMPQSESARRILALAERWRWLKGQRASLAGQVRALSNANGQADDVPKLHEQATLMRKDRARFGQEMRVIEALIANAEYSKTIGDLRRSIALQLKVMKVEDGGNEDESFGEADLVSAERRAHDAKFNGGWWAEEEDEDVM